MSIRSVLTELSEAYYTLKDDKRGIENAMNVASDGASRRTVNGKVLIRPEQIITVTGQDGRSKTVLVLDDKSSRSIIEL